MRSVLKKKKTRRIPIRVSPEEYEDFYKKYKSSTCRSFAQFFRVVLNNGPLTIKYRNESADDFLITAISLKNEWNIIARDLGQAVSHLLLIQDRHIGLLGNHVDRIGASGP